MRATVGEFTISRFDLDALIIRLILSSLQKNEVWGRLRFGAVVPGSCGGKEVGSLLRLPILRDVTE